jgi:integrase
MARRGNGEGTICQRKDGRWCAAVYVLLPNGGEKRMFVYGRTREDVHAKLVELQEKRRRNVPVVPRSLKLGGYLDHWLAQVVRPAVRWNTYKKYEQTVRLYLKPGLGRKPLSRVRVADVQAFLNRQIEAGHSIAKVQIMRTVLGAAFTRAMREELVFTNPAHLATLPTAPASRNRPWSADEARRFLTVARNDPLYPAFVLLLVYGLRRGEVLGLAWEDVDLVDDMMRVGWQLQRIDGQLARVPVKTAAGRRELPLVLIARDALIEQAERQAAARRRAGASWAGNDLIFTTRSGQPVEPRNLVRSFERLIDRAGLRKIRLHDLRHTVATLLKALRVPQRDAMQILGHARISVTLEIYTDSDSDSQRDALTRMSDRLFGQAGT